MAWSDHAVYSLSMADPVPTAEADAGPDRPPEGWSPSLRVSEDLTPLPYIDRALPILALFAGLVGRGGLARYRVAVLRELAMQPRARVKIREIQESIDWLEPGSVTRLVQDLRTADLLIFDDRTSCYQLSTEARVVAAVCGALTASSVDYLQIIKVLAAAMKLADAMNAPSEAAYATLLSAIAVLEFDYQTLQRLLNDYSEDALLEAATMAGRHVEDMKDLLEEQAGMFARFQGDPRFLEHDQRAYHVIATLGQKASEVVRLLSHRADVRMRGAMRVSREDVRRLVAGSDLDELTTLVAERVRPAVFLPAVDVLAAFTALDDYLGRARQPATPPPPPRRLPVESVSVGTVDPIRLAADALAHLAALGGAPLADWVVRDHWPGALARMASAVEAWSRYGPNGEGTLSATLDAQPVMAAVDRHGVGWMSVTEVHPLDAGVPV
jgi:hypothetical protein